MQLTGLVHATEARLAACAPRARSAPEGSVSSLAAGQAGTPVAAQAGIVPADGIMTVKAAMPAMSAESAGRRRATTELGASQPLGTYRRIRGKGT